MLPTFGGGLEPLVPGRRTLCGQIIAVEQMFADLVQKSPELGLKVNVSKCWQWGPTTSWTALAHCIPWDSGVKVLGVPVGSPGFIQD